MNIDRLYTDYPEPDKCDYNRAVKNSFYSTGIQPLVINQDDFYIKKQKSLYYANEEVLSFRECFFMLIIQFIPIVGLILSCYWTFEGKEITPKKTLAKALLCCQGIFSVISILLFIL